MLLYRVYNVYATKGSGAIVVFLAIGDEIIGSIWKKIWRKKIKNLVPLETGPLH